MCLNAVAAQQEFIWERVFSARVFHNSKTFQNEYKNSTVTILKNYSPYYEEEIDAETLPQHIIFTPTRRHWSGKAVLNIGWIMVMLWIQTKTLMEQ